MATQFDNSIEKNLNESSLHTGEGVVIDIGTGDGRFVSAAAKENPNKFYIGIDVNVSPLEKISEKIHRKPAKGGARGLDRRGRHGHSVDKRLDADETGARVLFGLRDHVLSAAESDLQADLVHRIGEQGCEIRRRARGNRLSNRCAWRGRKA